MKEIEEAQARNAKGALKAVLIVGGVIAVLVIGVVVLAMSNADCTDYYNEELKTYSSECQE